MGGLDTTRGNGDASHGSAAAVKASSSDGLGPLAVTREGDGPGVQWHPKITQILDYWRAKTPPGRLPGRQHIDPMELRQLLPLLWLLDVQREPFRLRYRLVGTAVADAMGQDFTGRWMDEVHPHLAGGGSAYLDRYRAVAATGVPSWRRGTPRLWFNEEHKEIENIVLPLAADGVQVDVLMILTIMYWRRELAL